MAKTKDKTNTINISIVPPFLKWYNTPKRFKIAFGGRGSGKSESIIRLLLLKSFEVKHNIVCLREVQKSIDLSTYNGMKDVINIYNLQQFFDVRSDKIVNTTNNCTIFFKGLNNITYENIKSISPVSIAFVEEASAITSEALMSLGPSIRAKDSEIWFSFNPNKPEDAIMGYIDGIELEPQEYCKDRKVFKYKEYEDKQRIVLNINYDGNCFWTKELEEQRQFTLTHQPREYNHVWLGEVAVNHGEIFYANKLKQYDDTDIDLSSYKTYALIDPAFGEQSCFTSCIVYKKTIDGYYLLDTGLLRNDDEMTTDETIIEFLNQYKPDRVMVEANFGQKELQKRLSKHFNTKGFLNKINKIERIVNYSYEVMDKVYFRKEWFTNYTTTNTEFLLKTNKGRGFIGVRQLINFSDIKRDNNKKGDDFSYIDFPDALTSIIIHDKISSDIRAEERDSITNRQEQVLDSIFDYQGSNLNRGLI